MANILVVDDDAEIREALQGSLSLQGYDVSCVASAHEALCLLHDSSLYDLVISDVQMKSMDGLSFLKSIREARIDVPVILMTAFSSVDQAVSALHAGASDYISKPINVDSLLGKIDSWVTRGRAQSSSFVAGDQKTLDLLALARKVSSSEVSVMISGPSGAGKEVMASYIHLHSKRAQAPFVAINCAAIPENMLEAVLFGYEKGAYTGAYKSMPGKFEQAQGGTLLLDEISEMDMGLQAKLLRVIQEREVERLGSRDSISLDVRIIATTNRTLRDEVAQGRFREDLFYRLNVFPLNLPPLAGRVADIEPLANLFLAKHSSVEVLPKRFSNAAMARLLQHGWQGNVRELENVVQRALVLTESEEIGVADIHFEEINGVSAGVQVNHEPSVQESGLGSTLKSRESEVILQALKQCRGHRNATAEALGISPRTLRTKILKMREQGYQIPETYKYSA